MANSTQTATSDGSLVLLDISIDYLDREEISVFFDSIPVTEGVEWDWVGVSERRLSFSPAVANGVEVLVRRTTDASELRHQFSGGAAFTPQTLDEVLKQTLHIVQEAQESNLSQEFFADIDMHGNRITNLGVEPSEPLDAVTVEVAAAAAAVESAAAAASAVAADASAVAAAISEANAADSEAAAAISEANAAATLASAVVVTGNQSVAGVKTFTDTPVLPAIGNGLVPTGVMLDFAGGAVPTGFLACNGAAVSRTTYAVLFAQISTTWGAGDGSTTFNVPNAQRRVAVGSGGSGSGTLGNVVGNTGGAETHTLTTPEMPSHTHPLDVATIGAGVTLAQVSLTAGAITGNSGSTGGGGAHNNLQPSMVVTKIIKT